MKDILAFGAHPDDIELGCGGTLLKFAKAGYNVYLCVLSAGEGAGNPVERKKEQEESAKRMGVKELIWGDWKDTEFTVSKDCVKHIESIVNRINPYEIYVNYFDDTHQDHRALAQCVISATRYNKRVLFYEDYTSENFNPNIFVDIEDVIEDKYEVLSSFKSQVSRNFPSGPKMIEGAKAVAHFRGFQAKVNLAEGFNAVRYLKLDFLD